MSLRDFAFDRLAAVSIDGRQVGLTFSILRLARCFSLVLRWVNQAESSNTSLSGILFTLGHENRKVLMDLLDLGIESKVWKPASVSLPRT